MARCGATKALVTATRRAMCRGRFWCGGRVRTGAGGARRGSSRARAAARVSTRAWRRRGGAVAASHPRTATQKQRLGVQEGEACVDSGKGAPQGASAAHACFSATSDFCRCFVLRRRASRRLATRPLAQAHDPARRVTRAAPESTQSARALSNAPLALFEGEPSALLDALCSAQAHESRWLSRPAVVGEERRRQQRCC